jgi:hypothetical protein
MRCRIERRIAGNSSRSTRDGSDCLHPGSKGADPYKLQKQIVRFGRSTVGMPALEVYRGSDAELMISDGVTRATRVAKLLPGSAVRVEVLDDLPTPFGHLPTVKDRLP